jgi:hypothetical protein
MATLKSSFSPEHLTKEAEQSGFLQCKQCGLVWFGGRRGSELDKANCPEGRHGQPVHVVIVCRTCDEVVPVNEFAEHLAGKAHQVA